MHSLPESGPIVVCTYVECVNTLEMDNSAMPYESHRPSYVALNVLCDKGYLLSRDVLNGLKSLSPVESKLAVGKERYARSAPEERRRREERVPLDFELYGDSSSSQRGNETIIIISVFGS